MMAGLQPVALYKKKRIKSTQDEEGKVIEKGEVVHSRGNWWKFATQTKGHTIIAEAWDLPKTVAKFVLG